MTPLTVGAAPTALPSRPVLQTEIKKEAEQTMDDFFDDVELSEPEEDKSEVPLPVSNDRPCVMAYPGPQTFRFPRFLR